MSNNRQRPPHFVQRGESLSIIAAMYNTSVAALMKLNPQIENKNLIREGHRIQLPPGPGLKDDPLWLRLARRELGISEIAGPEHNPRILEYHDHTSLDAERDEVHWCSSFVNFCIQQAGLTGTRSAMARSWLKWGRPIDEPRPGCVVVLRRGKPPSGHVGFFIKEENNRLFLLGGNQGDRVCIVSFPRWDVIGYRWPDGGHW